MADVSTLFSENVPPLSHAELPDAIREASEELSTISGNTSIVPRKWNEKYVAIPLALSVDLPSRGPVDDIDIRSTEPVFLLFHRYCYPYLAPLVFSDRQDFPTARLPHLNPTAYGTAPWLCLHRGSIDDWFAEHSLREFVERVRSWLRDAASGRLIRESDQFEHTRISDSRASIVFETDEFDAQVRRYWKESSGDSGYAFYHAKLLGDALHTDDWMAAFITKIQCMLTGLPEAKNVELVTRWNDLPLEVRRNEQWALGLSLWPPQRESATYFGHLPTTYAELREFALENSIPLVDALVKYWENGARVSRCIPISMSILRPQPLIGTSTSIEWLSFVIVAGNDGWPEGPELRDQHPVIVQRHRRSLTPAFASKLSNAESPSGIARPIIVGCGAIGSKLSLHLAKSGVVNQLLVDSAELAPHHLVRHGLLSEHLGQNKAGALKKEITSLFDTAPVKAVSASAIEILRDPQNLEDRTLLVDATASASVLSAIINAHALPDSLRVCRCEIADQGRLGFLFCEGPKRNPRLDDLQAHLWHLGREDEVIGQWLTRHRDEIEGLRGPALEEIGLGIGCSSSTMRLGDDTVAYHTSQMSLGLRHHYREVNNGRAGLIRISSLTIDGRCRETKDILLPSIKILRSRNSRTWSVRVSGAACALINKEFSQSGSRETGGILIGYIQRKRKIVYVTDVLLASPDSAGTPSQFRRGADYTEKVNAIEQKTAGLLGYVGEWHTHPRGQAKPSPTDIRAVTETLQTLGVADMPAVLCIMAPQGGLKSYVYEKPAQKLSATRLKGSAS